MLGAISSAVISGIHGQSVHVEVHVSNGFPGFTIVGLPDAACRESRDRVRAAFLSSGIEWALRHTTINLAPASVRKGGATLDLAIAMGLLVATKKLEPELVKDIAFFGELGLDGSIRPVSGVLSLVEGVDEPCVVVPYANVGEAQLVASQQIRSARTLGELIACLQGFSPWELPEDGNVENVALSHPDFVDVRGHGYARWALEIAAAGGHHAMLVGPPGSGKSMLARRLPSILPPLDADAALETTRVHSVAGLLTGNERLVTQPPLRAPHHTATAPALLGGGAGFVRPGDVSLATNGVLFLDEFPEFASSIVEALRQPLEDGIIRISRSVGTVVFPAHFQLIATMNPCPCGEGTLSGLCRCSDFSRARYARKMSGPILDRVDLRVYVDRPDPRALLGAATGESSEQIQLRVVEARKRAAARGVRCNADLVTGLLDTYAKLSDSAERLLIEKLERDELSARGSVRVRRIARTIADLAGDGDMLSDEHIAAALSLRPDVQLLQVA